LLLTILATVPQLAVEQDLRLAVAAVQTVEQDVSWVDERVIYSSGLVAALLPVHLFPEAAALHDELNSSIRQCLRLTATQPSVLRALALVASIQSQEEEDRAIIELAYAVLPAVKERIAVSQCERYPVIV
jgi:hypothetical protein